MMTEASLEKAKAAGGEGWTADRFYLTEEGGLVLLKTTVKTHRVKNVESGISNNPQKASGRNPQKASARNK